VNCGRGTQHFPQSGRNPFPRVPVIRPALPLADVPMLTNLTWRNVAVLIAVLVIASGCIAWGIIITTDRSVRSVLYKGAVTQKVLPLKVGRSSLTNSNSPALAPNEDQKAESPKSLAEARVTQKPTEPSEGDANAKLEDRPWASGAKSGKGRAEADVEPGRNVEKRNFQNSKRDGTMIIVRTIFPRWAR
jgi:hypothetical protein